MSKRTKWNLIRAAVIAGALGLSQAAMAGRVIVNNDEWTFTEYGFLQATPSTTVFATNLASFMNVDGGPCNLLVYSSNVGLTGSSFKSALNGAGCSVTYSTGVFDLATLSGFDGVLLGGAQFAYDAATLATYVNGGHSAYIAAGTARTATDEGIAWDSLTAAFGLDFGPSYNGIIGTLSMVSADPLLAGVSQLYFNNGNTVSLLATAPDSRIIATYNGAGLIGVYDRPNQRVTPQLTVPEPATIALLVAGLAGLGFSRRRPRSRRIAAKLVVPAGLGLC
jgi:hypothetical protein